MGGIGSAIGGLGSGFVAGRKIKAQREEAKATSDTMAALKELAGRSLQAPEETFPRTEVDIGRVVGKKKGGRIKKTGMYRLHKGEVVVPTRIAKRIGRKTGRR